MKVKYRKKKGGGGAVCSVHRNNLFLNLSNFKKGPCIRVIIVELVQGCQIDFDRGPHCSSGFRQRFAMTVKSQKCLFVFSYYYMSMAN